MDGQSRNTEQRSIDLDQLGGISTLAREHNSTR